MQLLTSVFFSLHIFKPVLSLHFLLPLLLRLFLLGFSLCGLQLRHSGLIKIQAVLRGGGDSHNYRSISSSGRVSGLDQVFRSARHSLATIKTLHACKLAATAAALVKMQIRAFFATLLPQLGLAGTHTTTAMQRMPHYWRVSINFRGLSHSSPSGLNNRAWNCPKRLLIIVIISGCAAVCAPRRLRKECGIWKSGDFKQNAFQPGGITNRRISGVG